MNMLIFDENAAGVLVELGGEADFPVENNRSGKSARIRYFFEESAWLCWLHQCGGHIFQIVIIICDDYSDHL